MRNWRTLCAWLLFWGGLLGVTVPLAVIWIPELLHYNVRPVPVTNEAARNLVSGIPPAVCTEFARFDLSGNWAASPDELRAAQAAAGRFELALAGRPGARFDPNFSRDEFLRGPSSLQLMIAMLVAPQLLVGEYENSGNPAAFEAARSYLRGWWKLEKATVLPGNMQWNDHAVAGRVFPLTAYLCAASKRKDFPQAEASEIVSALLTTGNRLLKPGYFTVRTNHGLMQTVALLHLAAMFPSLPQAKEYSAVAASRLADQLDFYISQEGVVLEHSAGYQAYGLHLLSLAARYLQELRVPIPARLQKAYPLLVRFHAQLRRPDGTLPAWGDTLHRTGMPLIARDKVGAESIKLSRADAECEMPSTFVAPVSGVAVWWDRAATGKECGRNRTEQTLVVWSDFASQAHKHIDEMSVFLWARNFNLLTGSGYWPYDAPNGREALGWSSGNAPRYVGEREDDRGKTVPIRTGSSDGAEFIEMLRKSATGSSLRREVLYVRPGRWWLVDSDESTQTGPQRDFQFHLTFDPRLAVRPISPPSLYELVFGDEVVARLHLAGCAGGRVDIMKGSMQPFLGWTAANGKIEPAYALLRRCPAGSKSFVGFDVRPESTADPGPQVETSQNSLAWSLSTASVVATRETDRILFRDVGGDAVRDVLRIDSIQGYTEAKEKIDAAYQAASVKYDRYVESWGPWRAKVSRAIVIAFLIQVVIFACALAIARPSVRRRPLLAVLGAAGLVSWLLLAVWLGNYYFA